MKLKAYAVWEGDNRSEHAELVFARTSREAKLCGWKNPHADCFEEWIEMRVARVPDADHLAAPDAVSAYACHDWKVLREAGWGCEDGRYCDCCGLNDFDYDEFRVCNECNTCIECGHADDCPEAPCSTPPK